MKVQEGYESAMRACDGWEGKLVNDELTYWLAGFWDIHT